MHGIGIGVWRALHLQQLLHAVSAAEPGEQPRRYAALLQQELQQLKHWPHQGNLQQAVVVT